VSIVYPPGLEYVEGEGFTFNGKPVSEASARTAITMHEQNLRYRAALKAKGSIVLTLGTFDLLHAGHIDLLESCSRLAGRFDGGPEGRGRVVVALNTDEFVAQYKGLAPVVPFKDRLRCVAAVRYIDTVVENGSQDGQSKLINAVSPDIIAVGSDWADKDYPAQLGVTWKWLRERDIRVLYVPRMRPVSSTGIKGRIDTCLQARFEALQERFARER
jgi:cytidyltransferase-like protein